MELRQLETFQTVAEHLSFTKAAARLNYAQSTVTGQIKALESSLKATLFDRRGGTIRLTDEGRRILSYAERMLALADEARASVAEPADLEGSLVVGTMESITSYRMRDLLELFHHRYPGVRLFLRPSLCAETCEALHNGDYDLGFLMEDTTSFPGLDGVTLVREELDLVAAPSHELAGRPLDTADLLDQAILVPERGCAFRDLFEKELTSGGAAPSLMELGTVEAVKRGVASGLGIALLPRMTLEEETVKGDLVRLDWRPPFTLHSQLVWREDRRLTPVQRLFVEQTVRAMREQEPALAPPPVY
ncbi:LysR family transcriptional regulator [Salininema proteolyticum]|uniref:LysR family transcriptional regulator n=1 Tax=Salininema proteolyticum TaxID=1607685 RepID=A0ABV8TW22_9ACTN